MVLLNRNTTYKLLSLIYMYVIEISTVSELGRAIN